MRANSSLPFAVLHVVRRFAPAGDRLWLRQLLRKAWYRRAVAAFVLLAFLPVVSAMVVCEAECLARTLTGGGVPAGVDQTQHDSHGGRGAAPAGHLNDAGPCHMAAIPIYFLPAGGAVDPVPTGDQWMPETGPCFASVAWPPPRPRPKLTFS
jgi:hypothetical protein